jgi:hypothetical protein
VCVPLRCAAVRVHSLSDVHHASVRASRSSWLTRCRWWSCSLRTKSRRRFGRMCRFRVRWSCRHTLRCGAVRVNARYYTGVSKVAPMMRWIASNCHVPLTLPELPQFNDEVLRRSHCGHYIVPHLLLLHLWQFQCHAVPLLRGAGTEAVQRADHRAGAPTAATRGRAVTQHALVECRYGRRHGRQPMLGDDGAYAGDTGA